VLKKNTKQWEIEIINEFKHAGVAKELVNMVSRKKIDNLSQANKRTVFWAAYWMKKIYAAGIKMKNNAETHLETEFIQMCQKEQR